MAEITITETEQRRTSARIHGAGFSADTMAGGMVAWTRAGLPTT